jgi:hypothetical protein
MNDNIVRPRKELILPPGVKRPKPKPQYRPEVALHLESDFLLPLPKESWPEDLVGDGRDAAWLSKDFMVQQFAPKRGWIRLTISRTELGDDGHWNDAITWEELMQVKRECGFADRDAVEAFPKDRDVINVANMRHLWVPPIHGKDYVPFIWRRKK